MRYKELHSEIAYRKEVGALAKVKRHEEYASNGVRASEQLFWKEVARASSGAGKVGVPAQGSTAPPLDRLLAAHKELANAKRTHTRALTELHDGLARVSQTDAMRTKARELHQALKQRCRAVAEGKREEDVAELCAAVPSAQRLGPDAGALHVRAAVGLSEEKPVVVGMVQEQPSVPLPGGLGQQILKGFEPTLRSYPVDAAAVGVRSPSSMPQPLMGASSMPSIRSVEVHTSDERPTLSVQCTLRNGTPVALSLSKSPTGALQAVVESPHIGVNAQMSRERTQILSRLSSLGIQVASIEVKRGGDATVDAGRQQRRSRWREEGEDESGIA
jgi:hypothetical protein